LIVCIGVGLYIIFILSFFIYFSGGQLVGRKPFLAACHTYIWNWLCIGVLLVLKCVALINFSLSQ